MSRCPDELTLSLWRDGELSDAEAVGVAEHVASCETCRVENDGWSAFERDAARALALPSSLSEGLRERVARAVRADEQPMVAAPRARSSLSAIAAIAAAAAAAAAIIIGLVLERRAPTAQPIPLPERPGTAMLSSAASPAASSAARTTRTAAGPAGPAAPAVARRKRVHLPAPAPQPVPAEAVVVRLREREAARGGIDPRRAAQRAYVAWVGEGDAALDAHPLDPATRAWLLEHMAGARSARRRAFARSWLAETRRTDVVAALVDGARDETEREDLVARWADEDGVAGLIAIVADASAPITRASGAAELLGRIGDRGAQDERVASALTELTRRDGGFEPAVRALGAVGTAAGLEALVGLWRDESDRVRARAGAATVPAALRLADARRGTSSTRAIMEAVARYRTPQAVPVLADGLRRASTRRLVRTALNDIVGRDLGVTPDPWKSWWERRGRGGGAGGRLPISRSRM